MNKNKSLYLTFVTSKLLNIMLQINTFPTVKPLVRTGIRGRRPKALTQRLIAEGLVQSPPKDIKPVLDVGGTVASPDLRK